MGVDKLLFSCLCLSHDDGLVELKRLVDTAGRASDVLHGHAYISDAERRLTLMNHFQQEGSKIIAASKASGSAAAAEENRSGSKPRQWKDLFIFYRILT